MQVIAGTFASYAGAELSFTMKKYAKGGTVWEPVVGFGTRSGGAYMFGENGPETVVPGAQGGGDTVAELRRNNALLEKLIDTTASVPHGVTNGLGAALGGAAQSARRSPPGTHAGLLTVSWPLATETIPGHSKRLTVVLVPKHHPV
jgi:hypothetical protein